MTTDAKPPACTCVFRPVRTRRGTTAVLRRDRACPFHGDAAYRDGPPTR